MSVSEFLTMLYKSNSNIFGEAFDGYMTLYNIIRPYLFDKDVKLTVDSAKVTKKGIYEVTCIPESMTYNYLESFLNTSFYASNFLVKAREKRNGSIVLILERI